MRGSMALTSHPAEEEGACAYDNGHRFVENPYPEDSEANVYWSRGWDAQHKFDLETTHGADFG